METPLLQTKLYIPPPRPKLVTRPRLLERLTEGVGRKLTLISAPAGFGKTTLISEWIYKTDTAAIVPQIAWLSLDDGDNDLTRFLAYFIAALQTIAPDFGERVGGLLHAPQPLPSETILTTLLNEITTISAPFVFVLDDYHLIEDQAVDEALTFLLDHLPPQMHLVITTRQDPPLPLARYRGGQACRPQFPETRAVTG